jgi:molybdopterin/thiamine biosynthesis adenylyltransferase
MTQPFEYEKAFARNIGWVTHAEQSLLRGKRVAIAGMGGVGGEHLLTLTRLGIGRFRIADFDSFDIANLNRQAGASTRTLGLPKAEVLATMARDINPELDIDLWPIAIDAGNVERFLEGVDIYVDGLDFFAFDARAAVFAACHRLGIPAVTAAPLGMGTAVLNFLPGGMSFEDYFGWGHLPDDERALRFMVGLAPRLLQDYLADATAVDLAGRRGPSTAMACQLCAGVAATEVLKILLGRGRVRAAPHGFQFDAYRSRFVRTWRPGGHRHPTTRLVLAVARRRLAVMRTEVAR